jgi:hypothetical protein
VATVRINPKIDMLFASLGSAIGIRDLLAGPEQPPDTRYIAVEIKLRHLERRMPGKETSLPRYDVDDDARRERNIRCTVSRR